MKTIAFQNNKGQVVHLPANMTIKQMLQKGITFAGLVPKGTPPGPTENHYQNIEPEDEHKPAH